jgi:hypothetical protein
LYGMKVKDSTVFAQSMEEFTRKTGFQKHGVKVKDYKVFANASEPDHAPSNQGKLYDPDQVDLRPKLNSTIIDAAEVIPGINENYTGKAPDLGAYEYGQEIPVYGPRTIVY